MGIVISSESTYLFGQLPEFQVESVPPMNNATLGSDAAVNLRVGIASHLGGRPTRKKILEEMGFQEIVDEDDARNQEPHEIVPDRDERQPIEDNIVTT